MSEYSRFHRDRLNLAIHAVMVPVFAVCTLAAAWSLAAGEWLRAAALSAGPVLSLAAQGWGHRREATPPLPFTGPGNFVARILAEQFFRFPIFVLGGGWGRAWREGAAEARPVAVRRP